MLTKKESHKKDLKNAKHSGSSPADNSQPLVKAPNQLPAKQETPHSSGHKIGQVKTKITVKYDVGFNNQVTIRGQGANLSWEKGQPFKNVKADEWVWETDAPFTQCEFKVLINDRVYEIGDNHLLNHGATLLYTPRFY